ncbi:MAG TPA: hypothetical protein VEA16_12620, partial [Vicinamibacterales bacterium]|nr:hypothetical protein [Vicinamibacterales bacterium]
GLGVMFRIGGRAVSSAGNIVISGTGARGVSLDGFSGSGGLVQAGGSGSVTITGTSIGTGSEAIGVALLFQNGSVQTSAGNITITGTGSASGVDRADGVAIQGARLVTDSGVISVTGTGGAAIGGNMSDGIRLDSESASGLGGIVEASGTGSIVMTGTAGTNGKGIAARNSNGALLNRIGSSSMSGNISLIADSMDLASGSFEARTTGTGTISLRPLTAGRDIELGTSASDTSRLGLDGTEIGRLFSNNVVIGGSGHAGNISVVGAASFTNVGAGGTLTLQSGNASSTTGQIVLNNALSTAGNVVVSTAVGNVAFTQTGVTAITSGSGKSVSVSAANGAITTANANTDISTGGAVGSVTLVSRDGVGTSTNPVGLNTGNVSATATAGSVYTSNNQPTVLTGGTISGDYSFTATGDITQTGAVTANGTLTFNTNNSGNVTLTQAANDFNTVVFSSVNDVDIVDTNSITLGASTIAGNLKVTAGGNIGQSGAITANTVNKIATFNAGATGDISLGNTSNNFYEVRLTGRQVTLNTAGTLRVGNSTIYGNLSIDPVTSGSDLLIVGDETFAGGAPGTFNFVAAGNVIVTGAGNIGTLGQPVNVILNSNANGTGGRVQIGDNGANGTAQINTGGGNLTVGGGSDPTATAAVGVAGATQGVLIDKASISTGVGHIAMRGNGFASATNQDHEGVLIRNGTNITTTTGNITVVGFGGDGGGAGVSHRGVFIHAGLPRISSAGGTISITGTGGNGSPSAHGVSTGGAIIDTTGAGNVLIVGTGAANGGSASAAAGVVLGVDASSNPTRVRSSSTGNIVIQGTMVDPTSSGAGHIAATHVSVSIVESNATNGGSITITGNAAGVNDHRGVMIVQGQVSSKDGAIVITGTSNATGTNSHGIDFDDPSSVTSTGLASITLNGTAGVNGVGINFSNEGHTIGGASANGSIALNADTINIPSAVTIRTTGTNSIALRPLTPAREIQLGANADETGALGLSDAELARLFADNVVIGGPSHAGNIRVVGTAGFTNMGTAGTLKLEAGNASSTTALISVGNMVTAPGNVTLTTANGSIAFTQANATIGIQSGAGKTITFTASNGAITSTNGASNAADANAGTTGSVSLFAKSGIGATGNAVVFEAASISANNTTSGDVVLQTFNSLTLDATSGIVNTASAGGIDLTVTNANADITIGTPSLAGGTAVSSNNGNVVLTAGNSVIFAQGAGNVGINSGTANTTLTAGTANTGGSIIGQAANTDDVRARALTATASATSGAIGQTAALQSNLALATNGALTVSAGGNINVSEAGAVPLANVTVTGNTPYVTLASVAGPITVGASNFGVTTANLTLAATNGSIVAGTGNLLANTLTLHANGTAAGVGAAGAPVLSEANTVTGTANTAGFQVTDQSAISVGNV